MTSGREAFTLHWLLFPPVASAKAESGDPELHGTLLKELDSRFRGNERMCRRAKSPLLFAARGGRRLSPRRRGLRSPSSPSKGARNAGSFGPACPGASRRQGVDRKQNATPPVNPAFRTRCCMVCSAATPVGRQFVTHR
jgi:hypothetical protein